MTTPEQSAETIFRLLSEALSEDAPSRKEAEAALGRAEEQQDFFASLAQIVNASDEYAPSIVRWLAAVCGKNATPRSWRRRTRKNAVTDDERQFVCDTLLESLGERRSNIATQISVWVAAIARIDFPHNWPSVISDLCNRIRASDPNVSRHALITLDMTLKQLSSRRLMGDRMALYRAGPDVFALLFELFCIKVNQLIADARHLQPEDSRALDFIVYCLKGLRRIISHACTDLSHLKQLNQLFIEIEAHPDLFMCGATGGNAVQRRLSLLVAKLVRNAQERHPVSFQPFLSGFLRLYYNTIIAYNSNISDDRVCVHAVAFLTNTCQSPKYGLNQIDETHPAQQHQDSEDTANTMSQENCRRVVLSFFTDDATKSLIYTMIRKIFVLTESELETWANDPETLVREEETAAEWGTESLRYECEKLFNLFVIRDKKQLVPYIVTMTNSVPGNDPLLLDACYRAVGRAAHEIRGALDLNVWLNGPLGTALEPSNNKNLGSRVIQARSVWLIGQFVDQLTRETRIQVYQKLDKLMSNSQQDRVVALTAAKTLQNLVDDLGFDGGDFAPFMFNSIESCFKLIVSSSAYETKRDLLDTVDTIVSSCEPSVVALVANQTILSLPTLWEECGVSPSKTSPPPLSISVEESESHINGNSDPSVSYVNSSGGEALLRMSIVTLLTHLIRKTGDAILQVPELQEIVMIVLEFSIDPRPGRGGSHMMEEGCELWLAVVEASDAYSEELHKLFPYTVLILRRDYEQLSSVFELMKAYMLLGGEVFMREFSDRIMATLRRVQENVKDRGCLAASDVVDVVLRAFPQQGVRISANVLRYALERVADQIDGRVVMGAYMGLIARAALANVEDVEREVLRGDETEYIQMLELLIKHIDTMNRLPRRRVGVLALIGLCGRYCTSDEVLKNVPDVLNCVVQVLSEEKRIWDNRQAQRNQNDFENMVSRVGEGGEESLAGFTSGQASTPISNGALRRQELAKKDVENGMDVSETCMNFLLKLKGASEGKYTAVLAATDRTVIQQLESLLEKYK